MDLKKRLYRYIRKCRRQGYSLEQIKKGLIVYGIEPWFAENLITSYKSRVGLYTFLIFAVMIGLPLLAQPTITGYYFITNSNSSSGTSPVSEYLLISLVLLVIIPAYLMFYHLGIRERMRAIGSFESKIFIEKAKDFINKLKKPSSRQKSSGGLTHSAAEAYHETTPLSLMYSIFIGIGILGIFASIIFRIWMMIFFSIMVIIIAIIGHVKIKKMYYKEVE